MAVAYLCVCQWREVWAQHTCSIDMAQLLNLKITFEFSELYTSAKKLQLCYSNSLGQASSKSFSSLGSNSQEKQTYGIGVQAAKAQMSDLIKNILDGPTLSNKK